LRLSEIFFHRHPFFVKVNKSKQVKVHSDACHCLGKAMATISSRQIRAQHSTAHHAHDNSRNLLQSWVLWFQLQSLRSRPGFQVQK
jgi:hypothetical protein